MSKTSEKTRAWMSVFESPILTREMRAQMRGGKFFLTLVIAVALASVVTLIALAGFTAQGGATNVIGSGLFWVLTILQGGLVMLVIPAFSCTAITSEKENKTYDLVLTTDLKPWEIVWGKFLASITTTLLLLSATLPLVTLTFLYGGVSVTMIFFAYLGIFCLAGLVGITTLSISAYAKNSRRAIGSAYFLTLFAGVPLLFAVSGIASTASRGGFNIDGHNLEFALFVTTILYVYCSMFSLSFIMAVNKLKPTSANRVTAVRKTIFVVTFLGILIFAAFLGILPSNQRDDKEPYFALMFLVWFVSIVGACGAINKNLITETNEKYNFLKKISFPFTSLFYPRRANGMPFVLFLSGGAMVSVLVLALVFLDNGKEQSDIALLTWCLFSYLVLILGVGYLIRCFARTDPIAQMSTFGLLCFCALIPILNDVILHKNIFYNSSTKAWSPLYILDPFHTVIPIMNRYSRIDNFEAYAILTCIVWIISGCIFYMIAESTIKKRIAEIRRLNNLN